ncbi:MAG: hypothetical protein INH41_05665 [Myxococcaceae bacterium]|nr:hypothetical protein [Myxococcaceae bacterium]
MPRAYSMRGVQGAADRAVRLATDFLHLKAPGGLVHDVQQDPRFQHRGIDLLWDRRDQSEVLGVEVKGDRQGRRRGNYFFELISNAEKDAPGCFLYSTADLLLYVFLDVREVHCLSLEALRGWFLPRAREYPLKSTKTRTGAHLYTTVGAIVPLRDVKAGVPGALEVHPFGDATAHAG